MANMSYCRFENTLRDLRDCANHMDDGDANLSDIEAQSKEQLIELCEDIAEMYSGRDDKVELDDDGHPTECRQCLKDHGIEKSYHGERDIYMERCNTCEK